MGMEGSGEPPKIEGVESVYDRLLQSIYQNGVDSDETQALREIWLDEEMKEVEESNDPKVKIRFEIRRIDLYIAAGDMEGARIALTDAWTIAQFDGEGELAKEIEKRSETLGMASMVEEMEARRDVALDESKIRHNKEEQERKREDF